MYGTSSEKSKKSDKQEEGAEATDNSRVFNEQADSKEDNKDLVSDEELSIEEPGAETLKSESEKISKPHKKRVGRKPFPEDMRRVEEKYELAESELKCECGGDMCHISDEVREVLAINLREANYIRKILRAKYACKSCSSTVKRADSPAMPIKKSMIDASMLTNILINKYEYHLPLHRQAMMFEKNDIDISKTNLVNWTRQAGSDLLLGRLYKLMHKEIISSDYVCSDETTTQVLDNDKSKNYIWCHITGNVKNRIILYDYQEDRKGERATNFLNGFAGAHQSDGYSGYNNLHNRDDVVGAGCMAHARRKFQEILQISKSATSDLVLLTIGELYKIERAIKEKTFAKKYKVRQEKSKPIMNKLKVILQECQSQSPPKSALGSAANYALNQWDKLSAYLDNGQIHIDNNDTERAIRSFVIGRKNWMFHQNNDGADTSCIIYSVIESCKANKINARRYLNYILNKLPVINCDEELTELLPHKINKKLFFK